ncbi:MAG TPA: hypothetical protein PLS53_06345 [Thermoanaerobaculaceae bacterium]|nr:hypothetical protein [Thermoanaerobaculaceae bacterium]
MPRLPAVATVGGFLHVSNRVANGERPFLEPDEVESFVQRVLAARERDRFTVFAWCLMSNHYHLVVSTREVPFAASRQLVEGGPTASLWMPRCRARSLPCQPALDRAVAYVHRNPVSAGLVSDPAEYPWSGHRELAGLDAPLLVDVRLALARFGTSPDHARQGYLDMMRRACLHPGSARLRCRRRTRRRC